MVRTESPKIHRSARDSANPASWPSSSEAAVSRPHVSNERTMKCRRQRSRPVATAGTAIRRRTHPVRSGAVADARDNTRELPMDDDPPDSTVKKISKRSCQGGGHRLRCSRSYERCGCKRKRERGKGSSSAGSVEAERIFDRFFRRLKGRLFHLRKRRCQRLEVWQQVKLPDEMFGRVVP